MRSNPLSAASVGNVRPDTPPRHGKSAPIVRLSHVRRNTDSDDTAETRAVVARLYNRLFDGRTAEEMDYRAAMALSISPDQARRIRLKRSGTRSDVVLTMIDIACSRGMDEAEVIRLLRRRRAAK